MTKNRDIFHLVISTLTLCVLLGSVGAAFWWAADITRRITTIEACKIEIISDVNAAEKRIGSLEMDVSILKVGKK
jgi:hypothetical protein